MRGCVSPPDQPPDPAMMPADLLPQLVGISATIAAILGSPIAVARAPAGLKVKDRAWFEREAWRFDRRRDRGRNEEGWHESFRGA